MAEAERLARRAVELGKDDALALSTAGSRLAYVVGDLDDGAAFIDQALALNPNLAWALAVQRLRKGMAGRSGGRDRTCGPRHATKPAGSSVFNMQTAMALAHFIAGRYAEALSWAETAVREPKLCLCKQRGCG